MPNLFCGSYLALELRQPGSMHECCYIWSVTCYGNRSRILWFVATIWPKHGHEGPAKWRNGVPAHTKPPDWVLRAAIEQHRFHVLQVAVLVQAFIADQHQVDFVRIAYRRCITGLKSSGKGCKWALKHLGGAAHR